MALSLLVDKHTVTEPKTCKISHLVARYDQR